MRFPDHGIEVPSDGPKGTAIGSLFGRHGSESGPPPTAGGKGGKGEAARVGYADIKGDWATQRPPKKGSVDPMGPPLAPDT